MVSILIRHTPSLAPYNFTFLFFGVWRHFYPSGEAPRYQVFRTPLAESVFEYRADVFLAVTLPDCQRTYQFSGTFTSTRSWLPSLQLRHPSLAFTTRNQRCKHTVLSSITSCCHQIDGMCDFHPLTRTAMSLQHSCPVHDRGVCPDHRVGQGCNPRQEGTRNSHDFTHCSTTIHPPPSRN